MGLAHGTHGWTDVASPDMEAGAAFYTGLFGWAALDSGPSESMPYTMFTMDGKLVAGMGPLSQEQIDAGQPPTWSAYVIVDDVDAIHARAIELGATPLMEPMQIMDSGKMAFIMDPVGAVIGFWESGTHDGAEVFNVPGAVTWNDLATRDVTTATAFYEALLGWRTQEMEMGEGTYWAFMNGDRMNAGAWDTAGHLPEDTPSHWMNWFLVADCAATATRATELGGTIVREPGPDEMGVSGVIADPFGAVFGIIETDQVDEQPPR